MTRAEDEDRRAWAWAAGGVAMLAAIRIGVLFLTPLELYPDEAQYWLWSRALAWGYFSKPPMIAWAIRATTALGGDAEAWVRLSAPLFQAGATLCAFAIGRRLYGPRGGLAAAALYALAPAVQLSATVAATDAPLLFFLGLALLAYVRLPALAGPQRLAAAAVFGAAVGLAFLSKYAAAYLAAGALAHLLLSRQARQAWTPATAALASAAAMAVLAPNLVWNAAHGFATVQHTAADADWDRGEALNLAGLARFLGEQVLIFGPIPAGALAVGAVRAVARRRLREPDLMLACFAAAPLLLVAAQALISRANANWTAAGYLPAAVLAGGLMVRAGARRWLAAALVLQGALAAVFMLAVTSPRVVSALHADNSLKRVRGWRETTDRILDRAQAEPAGSLSALAVDNRFLFHELAYYGRDRFASGRLPPLRAWLPEAAPQNQAELSAPLAAADAGRVLVASYEGWRGPDVMADFRQVSPPEAFSVALDATHRRRVVMFTASGFAPRPRLSDRATPP
jgi:4-amino-4-deoxy-L-arabinose transferase-like glycosyltransferase